MGRLTREKAIEICRLYQEGWTVGAAARHVGLLPTQASRALAAAGTRSVSKAKELNKKQLRLLAKLYKSRAPTAEIARRVGMSRCWIATVIRRLGLNVRAIGQQQVVLSAVQMRRLLSQWRSGRSLNYLSAEWGHGASVIRRLLEDGGVKFAPRHNTGEKHGRWRGGRILSHGYWMAYAREIPEMSSMINKTGYIPEHRLVMAKHLGRPLTRRETVHHINGDKLDNSLDNLQLRHGPHGKNECYRCRNCGSIDIEAVPIA